MRHAKLLAFIALAALGAAACYAAFPPRVVAVVRPYVPVIVVDRADVSWLGQTRCDLADHPYILVNPAVGRAQLPAILVHERVHVAQSEALGCRAFMARYAADSMFRLATEAEAFCATLQAQLALGDAPDPPLKTIVFVLLHKYTSVYEAAAVEAAIASCR